MLQLNNGLNDMSLVFSSHPGARERHLQRQYNNPLFLPERRNFDEQRLSGARFMDEQEQEKFLLAFHGLLEEVAQLDANEGSEKMLDLKSRLDESYEQCSGLSGDHESEKQAIVKLVEVIMASIRQSARGDAEAEINLKEEELARHTHYQLLQFSLLADLLRPRSPIVQDELVPTLLSESEGAVTAAFQLFDKEQQETLCQQAKQLLEQKLQEQLDLPQAWQRLALMQKLLSG